MELLMLLPLLLLGGLAVGVTSGDDGSSDTPSPEAGEVEAGTPGAEELAGTVVNDILLGGSGRDTVEGLGGNDVIAGEFGNDNLTGDDGNDIVLGGSGNDAVDGAQGRDLLIGGAGNDTLTGGSGNDLLFGSSGSDVLRGDEGDDTLFGLEYDRIAGDLAGSATLLRDELRSGFGNTVSAAELDRVAGGVTSGDIAERGPDQLLGGLGRDVLLGDDGDVMTGGEGVDAFGLDWRTGNAISQLEDFDYLTENLTLLLDNPDTAQIEIRADGATTTLVLVDGQAVARLIGQNAADLAVDPSSWLVLARP